jgi:hypothetical protein
MTRNNTESLNINTEVNELNDPIKRHRNCVKKKKKKNKAQPYVAYKKLISLKQWLRVNEWKKVFQANGPHIQAGVAIPISDKVDFRLKSIRRDNEGCFTLIKGTIHEKEISILNIYVPNIGAPNSIKTNKKPTNGLKNTNRPQQSGSGRPEYPLLPIDRASRQKNQQRNFRINPC